MSKSSKLQRQIEAGLIDSVYSQSEKAQATLFNYCVDYFWGNYKNLLNVKRHEASDILQETCITFWRLIDDKRLYVENGNIYYGRGKELTSNLQTFFMGIARLKHLEYLREVPPTASIEEIEQRRQMDKAFKQKEIIDIVYGSEEDVQLAIVSEQIADMTDRCREILHKFYFEDKDLDTILSEITGISNKDTLKSKKAKCLKLLKQGSLEIYYRYIKE